jgi:hypothetical protein
MQLRSKYAESKNASYRAMEEGITAKCDRLKMLHTDLFHKRQLIKSVVIPSFNHIFMSFGFCEEAASKLDSKVIKLFWTKKSDGEIKNKRGLVAKNRIAASCDMGGLQLDFTREIMMGLLLHGFQRLIRQVHCRDKNKGFLYILAADRIRGSWHDGHEGTV